MLLFDPEDRKSQKTEISGATQNISFFSTIGKVKAKLDSIGLDLASLRHAMKKLPLVRDDVIDFVIPNFLKNKKNLQAFLQWWEKGVHTLPEEIGFLLDELDEDFRYSSIGHLFLVRLLCDYLDAQTEIILDPSEVIELWEDFDSSRTDLHKRLLDEFADELETANLFSKLLVFSTDDATLLNVLHMLDENDLINYVLVPLLDEMGYRPVIPIKSHGPGELGKDIIPFFKENEFGFREYYAVQAKAVKIHARAGKRNNVNEVIDQAKTALSTTFFDPTDNSRKRIDHLIIVTSHDLSRDARLQIEESIEKKREIMLIDDQTLVKLLKRHTQVLRQILLRFSCKLGTTPKRNSSLLSD
jgi:hypothetical protein